MAKRGQVTFFIIIGIILLIILGIYFALRATLTNEQIIEPAFAPIKNHVDSCIESTARQALYELGQNSGYLYPPEKLQNPLLNYQTTPIKIPFWLFETQSFIALLPSLARALHSWGDGGK